MLKTLSGFQGDRLSVSRFSKHQLSDLQDTVYLAKAPFHLKKRIYHDIIRQPLPGYKTMALAGFEVGTKKRSQVAHLQ